jgi:D-sedoheptulose 7-phosphate isomerase
VTGRQGSGDSAMDALYPFLYATESDPEAVMAEVRRSTTEKAHEIIALRRDVVRRDGARLAECAAAMADAVAAGGRIFAFGNGGSSTDAAELANLFLAPGPGSRPVPAFALAGDIAALTALSNDVSFDVVYSRQIAAFGRPGDIAVGLSTSGNSENLVRAFDEAHRRGLITVGLAGYDGGKMAELSSIDYLFVVPSASVHRIQEAQTTLYHALWELTLDNLATSEAAGRGSA